MKRINITVNEPLHERLKRLSKETGVSVSEMFRRAADAMYGDKTTKETKQKRRSK
jgi:metal-responsive CopG/Arc/MetJ family transcriptional regulator